MPRPSLDSTLNRLTATLLSGDFDGYQMLFTLPLQIVTDAGQGYVLHTQAELRADFDLYHEGLTSEGITDIFRQVLEFQDVKPDLVIVRCLTHIMSKAHRVVDPFETHFHLRNVAEGWRISRIESSSDHINWTLGRSIISNSGKFQAKDAT